MPAERVLEIDDLSDFKRAEAILNAPVVTSYSSLGNASAVVFDFDGVLTDNSVYVMQNGRESVRCERGDGMGISLLRKAGMPMLVLSGERNSVVRSRCQKLGLACKYGVEDKLPVLMEWASKNQFPIESMVYVGNDVNDLDCLKAVGCGVAVADAHPAAKRAAKLTLTRAGGHGAVRELADLIVQARTSTP
jgi:N-acylneuraminate cytidylyltransferase